MILVVGGTGRLGRLVVSELAARDQVRVLSRHSTATGPPRDGSAELVDGDIRDSATVASAAQGVSCIVIASHGVASRERDGLETVDMLGARAVACAAREVGCSIVLVSMLGAAPNAALPLAQAKWAAEQVIREAGSPWTIVRASAFAQTWAMILTLSAGRSGRPAIIGPGTAEHRFVDVRDVASVVARAATDDSLRGRTLALCGPADLTVSQLATMVQEANSWTGRPRHLPLGFARAIERCLNLFRPDLARRVSIGIAMNYPQPADDSEVEAPSWIVMRPITPDAMYAESEASTSPAP